jgi:nitroimidazol reductase NimA-like FMN-containing flavoprotein (pyridoxamine 5'-phosphate oxidase superfamily)
MWIDQHGSEVLERNECFRLLAVVAKEGGICRLGVATSGSPIIVPVNFVYEDEGVVILIARSTIGDLAAGSLVAIEVDRVDEAANEAWSVLLRGYARVLNSSDTAARRLPLPLVAIPGDLVIFVRGDDITGRRFSLAEGQAEAD